MAEEPDAKRLVTTRKGTGGAIMFDRPRAQKDVAQIDAEIPLFFPHCKNEMDVCVVKYFVQVMSGPNKHAQIKA